jgi:hypothetical protein
MHTNLYIAARMGNRLHLYYFYQLELGVFEEYNFPAKAIPDIKISTEQRHDTKLQSEEKKYCLQF